MTDLPDEFTAIDPDRGFKVKVKANKTAGGFWVYEYGFSSPRFLLADTVRALVQYGRDAERAEIDKALKVDCEVRKESATVQREGSSDL